jgi:hypothetical protein
MTPQLKVYGDFLLFVIACVIVIIPLSAALMLARTWVIRKVSRWRLRRKYHHYASFGLNPLLVPRSLVELIPIAAPWRIEDENAIREMKDTLSPRQKARIARTIKGHEGFIARWLKTPRMKDTLEAKAFGRLVQTVYGWGLLVEPSVSTGFPIEAASVHYPLPEGQWPLIRYAPRPRTFLEKILYDLFSGVIVVLIFPVCYYLCAKTWDVALPTYHPDYGIAVVSISGSILALIFWRLARLLLIKTLHTLPFGR